MRTLSTGAPAKVNLCLFVGPARRADGRHELVSVMDSLTLADDVVLERGAGADHVICPGVDGPNLAADALAAFRQRTRWTGSPVRVRIAKRIPVAGGMAGGSADAAATLRLAAAAAGMHDDDLLEEIAASLGADVPSQVRGGLVLATGAGERLERLPRRLAYAVLVLPVAAELGAGAVYAEGDRLGLVRGADDLAHRLAAVRAAGGDVLAAGLVHNDLQDAARSLCPAIDEALAGVREAGADHALVSGSGPTVLGLFTAPDADDRAAEAHRRLAGREPAAVLSRPGRHGGVRER